MSNPDFWTPSRPPPRPYGCGRWPPPRSLIPHGRSPLSPLGRPISPSRPLRIRLRFASWLLAGPPYVSGVPILDSAPPPWRILPPLFALPCAHLAKLECARTYPAHSLVFPNGDEFRLIECFDVMLRRNLRRCAGWKLTIYRRDSDMSGGGRRPSTGVLERNGGLENAGSAEDRYRDPEWCRNTGGRRAASASALRFGATCRQRGEERRPWEVAL